MLQYARPVTDPKSADRLSNVAVELGISSSQAPVWQAFRISVEEANGLLARVEAARTEGLDAAAPTLLEALRAEAFRLSAYLAVTHALQDRARDLYAVLSHRQKKRADRLLPTVCAVFMHNGASAGKLTKQELAAHSAHLST